MHLLSVSLEFSRSDIFHDISRATSIKIHSRIVAIFTVVLERQWIRGGFLSPRFDFLDRWPGESKRQREREREREKEGGIFVGYCIKFAFLRVEEGKVLVKLFLLLELAIASFRKFTCNSFRIVCYEFLNRIEFPKLTLGNKIFLFRL